MKKQQKRRLPTSKMVKVRIPKHGLVSTKHFSRYGEVRNHSGMFHTWTNYGTRGRGKSKISLLCCTECNTMAWEHV